MSGMNLHLLVKSQQNGKWITFQPWQPAPAAAWDRRMVTAPVFPTTSWAVEWTVGKKWKKHLGGIKKQKSGANEKWHMWHSLASNLMGRYFSSQISGISPATRCRSRSAMNKLTGAAFTHLKDMSLGISGPCSWAEMLNMHDMINRMTIEIKVYKPSIKWDKWVLHCITLIQVAILCYITIVVG